MEKLHLELELLSFPFSKSQPKLFERPLRHGVARNHLASTGSESDRDFAVRECRSMVKSALKTSKLLILAIEGYECEVYPHHLRGNGGRRRQRERREALGLR